MKSTLAAMIAGPSLVVFAFAAQAAPAEDQSKPATVMDEVVVTARRVEESVMDVPQTVTAVSGTQLQEFNILKFEDISLLIPGLDLNSDNSGFRSTASVRGTNFDVSSQATPTVETYFNEVPVDPNMIFQGNFDIGQIEVLRGPQGTLRGRSAPSGSITQSTRRPDLVEAGSYVSTAISDYDSFNFQGAIGMPIIAEKFAVRLAAIYDNNDAGGVESVNNPQDPYAKTQGARLSLRYEPTDSIHSLLMYQHLERLSYSYGGILFGTGATGVTTPATATLPNVVAPPNFNGPVLVGTDRKSITEFPRRVKQVFDVVTLQADWAFAGQKLSYVGGYSDLKLDTDADNDATNTIIGKRGPSEFIGGGTDRQTHELRVSSDERIAGLIDYTVGGFYGRYVANTWLTRPDTLITTGAFGSPLGTTLPGGPGTLSPFTYDSRYAHDLVSHSVSITTEESIFANIMFHLGDKTEVSAGGRKIFSEYTKFVDSQTIAGITAVTNPAGLGACPATITVQGQPASVVGSTYPGTCDVRTAAPTLLRSVPELTTKDNPFVYSFSASYHFTPDLMTYVSYGTSWRAGPGPITGAPLCSANSTPTAPDPTLCDKFNLLDSEEAKGVEIGLKTTLFDQRLSLSLAGYQQEYDGYINFGAPTPYLTGVCTNPASAACRVTTGGFTYNADVETRGVDVDVSFVLNEDLNLGAAYSYSKGRFQDTPVPCRDQLDANGAPGFDGVPDSGALLLPAQWLSAGGPYGPSLCKVNSSSSSSTPWNANLRGEYSHELFDGGRGFVRALFNYYPENTNRQVSNASFVPDSYQLLSLYVGLRSTDSAWEVSLSGSNILDDETVLSETLNDSNLITPQTGRSFGTSSGYRSIGYVQRREFSLSVRYAFGSR